MEINHPLVSIIIVNFNGKNFLKNCLESLNQTNYKNYEIIIIDNNSIDESVEFVKSFDSKIQILELNKNFGFVIPNNMGAKIAKGKYLVFLNNDTTVTPNWLEELVFALENDSEISVGQSLLISPNGDIDSSGDFIDEIGRAYSSKNYPTKIQNIFSARAACMIIRRDLFLDMGGFDENYFASFEDVEFGWRSWLWGYNVSLIPTSIVYHVGGQTTDKIPDVISFHGIKNNILMRLTNFDRFDSVRSLGYMILILFVKKVFGISIGTNQNQKYQIPSIKIIFKAIWWILKNQKLISEKRKTLKSRQIRTNKELQKMGLITGLKS